VLFFIDEWVAFGWLSQNFAGGQRREQRRAWGSPSGRQCGKVGWFEQHGV